MTLAATLDAESLMSATRLLGPLACVIAALRLSGRGHWASPVLAAPALLLGAALGAALFNNAAGPGILLVLIYSPVLLALGVIALVRWRRRRSTS